MAIIRWRQVVALLVLFGLAGCQPAEHLLVETSIESEGVEPLEDSNLALFANGLDNYVFTGKGATLLRLGNGGRTLEPLYTFDDQIAGIHNSMSH